MFRYVWRINAVLILVAAGAITFGVGTMLFAQFGASSSRSREAIASPLSQGADQRVLTILRVVAIGCAGLMAGIYFGDRAGAYYARAELSDSSVVQFQQIVHVHYVTFMPPLILAALLAGLGWLFMVRSQWRSPAFWLIAASVSGILLIVVLTRSVNVPLNNALMTWNVAAPPADFRRLWAPWETVNTIRAFVATGVPLLEAVALSLGASNGRP